jgi:hypothetical protein
MLKFRLLLVFLMAVAGGAQAQIARELVGRYQMDVQGGDVLELRSDGSATLAGETTRWSAIGNRLVVGGDTMTYSLQGNRLLTQMGPAQIPWNRLGGASVPGGNAQAAAAKASPAQPTPVNGNGNGNNGGSPQDAQIRQVLTANAWCAFSYNKVSGTSSTRRVVFRMDGMVYTHGGGQTYSSGSGGSYAGQSSNGSAARWKVENQRLYGDAMDGSGFQDLGLTASRNSSGSLILSAGGREYSVCN